MPPTPAHWENTTHDWATSVDVSHLEQVRDAPDTYAPEGARHLVLEVLAYADDEAEQLGRRAHA